MVCPYCEEPIIETDLEVILETRREASTRPGKVQSYHSYCIMEIVNYCLENPLSRTEIMDGALTKDELREEVEGDRDE